MEREALIQRLMVTFLAEYEDHVAALDRDLLALEKDGGPGRAELVQRLFRTIHSLKGAARSVNVGPVEATCHRLEAVLGAARDGLLPIGPGQLQLLFEASTALREALARLRAGEAADGGGLAALQARLDAASGTILSPRVAVPPFPARVQPPVATPTPVPTTPLPATPASPAPARPAPASAAAAAPPAPAPPAPIPATDGVVRVAAGKLDALLTRTGELLVARRCAEGRRAEVESLRDGLAATLPDLRRLEKRVGAAARAPDGAPRGKAEAAVERLGTAMRRSLSALESLSRGMALDLHGLDQVADALDEEVRQVRMLPFRDVGEALQRLVRDLGHASGKEVELVVEGGEVELDRSILEAIRNPLAHLVRNAVDHGLELPADRIVAGKPRRGRVTLSATRNHGGIEVAVADDGRGVDRKLVREQAARRRLPEPVDDRELLRLLFVPGFSTAPIITEVSGRGVGLDVVRHGVDALHGSVEVASRPGHGARFALSLPLTLATVRALLVGCAGQAFALPSGSVRRLVRVGAGDLGSVEGREVLLGPASPVPVASLSSLLGLPPGPARARGGKALLAVVASGGAEVALAVDELIAEQDLLVKDLGPRLRALRLVSGGSILPSGSVALLLNPAELVLAASTRAGAADLARSLAATPTERRHRLLVVEDSLTTRTLERSILEAAGYEVMVAADGAEGWRLLQESPPDLVVADVEMPRLDGFGLTEAIRGSKRFHDLPVILVTALASERDQARGLEAGASAYLVKSAFDQRTLLEAIAQLL